MGKPRNTYADLELMDGSTVTVTLTYGKLLALRSKNREAYDRYNEVLRKKPKQREELDNLDILYAAYLCGCIGTESYDSAMGYEEFLDSVTIDREAVSKTLTALISPKRLGDFAKLSSAE